MNLADLIVVNIVFFALCGIYFIAEHIYIRYIRDRYIR
jgi:hypothetical protein